MIWWVNYIAVLVLGILWSVSLLLFCTFLIDKNRVGRKIWMTLTMMFKILVMMLFIYYVVSFARDDVGSSLLIFGFASALVLAIWLKRVFGNAELIKMKKI